MIVMYALGFMHGLRNQHHDPLWHSTDYDLGYAAGQHEYSLEKKQ